MKAPLRIVASVAATAMRPLRERAQALSQAASITPKKGRSGQRAVSTSMALDDTVPQATRIALQSKLRRKEAFAVARTASCDRVRVP